MPAPSPLRRTWRYGRAWLNGSAPVCEREVSLDRGDRRVPASHYRQTSAGDGSGAPAAWIVLHGITRPGRAHPSLVRFVRALAATGASVLVPEVPEWIELALAPDRARPTVLAALDHLEGEAGVTPGRVGLVGFSFGAPQVLVAAGDPALAGRLAAAVGFGGYCDLERTFRFLFTGLHEWEGVTERRLPDPYGRWIVGANFLTGVPGYEAAGPVRAALHELARSAGDRRVSSRDPVHDPVKRRLRAELPARWRPLFDRFAPPAADDPAGTDDDGSEWARRLAAAGRRAEPLAAPLDHIGAGSTPVHLVHGRGDDLIPYTETLRLEEHLRGSSPARPLHTTVTGLFSHSSADRRRHPLRTVGEAFRFVGALHRILASV